MHVGATGHCRRQVRAAARCRAGVSSWLHSPQISVPRRYPFALIVGADGTYSEPMLLYSTAFVNGLDAVPAAAAQCATRSPRRRAQAALVGLPANPRLLLVDIVEAAEALYQRIGDDCEHEQHNEDGVHGGHIEPRIGLDDEKADAAVGDLGFRKQRSDQGDTHAE